MKEILMHVHLCKIQAAGGCSICRRIQNLIPLHARNCRLDRCSVPGCREIKEHLRNSEGGAAAAGDGGGEIVGKKRKLKDDDDEEEEEEDDNIDDEEEEDDDNDDDDEEDDDNDDDEEEVDDDNDDDSDGDDEDGDDSDADDVSAAEAVMVAEDDDDFLDDVSHLALSGKQLQSAACV